MAKPESVINLDPIDRKKKTGILQRLLITRYGGGKRIKRMEPFGHYMFCGEQGSGKTSSALWYAEKLAKKYKRKGMAIEFYSNFGVGRHIEKELLFKTITDFNPVEKTVRIVIIDEIQTYFPKDINDKATQQLKKELIALFSQLRKRSTFILSTAQIYGRLDKALREQCLFMIDCKAGRYSNMLINDFIPQKDIMCDELGRWAGNPKYIYRHGLPKMKYDTKKIVRL